MKPVLKMSREYYNKRTRLCKLLYGKSLIECLPEDAWPFAETLNTALDWESTPQGWEFWAGLHTMMNSDEEYKFRRGIFVAGMTTI